MVLELDSQLQALGLTARGLTARGLTARGQRSVCAQAVILVEIWVPTGLFFSLLYRLVEEEEEDAAPLTAPALFPNYYLVQEPLISSLLPTGSNLV